MSLWIISDISELKKGDTVIVTNLARFEALGFTRVSGYVFDIEQGKPSFTIKCEETNSIEVINIGVGKIFLID